MSIAADISHTKAFIVVEGIDDVNFFKNKVSENVEVIESFSGKEGVKEILFACLDDCIIGICDIDYDKGYKQNRLFYYDYSCLEVMMIMNNDVFRQVMSEIYLGDLDYLSLRNKLFSDLKWFSLLRKYNFENDLTIRFDGIKMSNCYDIKNSCFDITKALKEINKTNPTLLSEDRRIFTLITKELDKVENDELPYITNGHDIFGYFHCLAENKKIKSKNISQLFRCAYRNRDLYETKLYRELKKYEKDHKVNLIS